MDVWDALTNGRFQPQVVADGVAQVKAKIDLSDDDKKSVQYNFKAQNILISFFLENILISYLGGE